MFLLLTWQEVRCPKGSAFKWLSRVLQDVQEELSSTVHSEYFLKGLNTAGPAVKFNNANLSHQFGISKSILSHNISYVWQSSARLSQSLRAWWERATTGASLMPQWFQWRWKHINVSAENKPDLTKVFYFTLAPGKILYSRVERPI